MHATTCGGSGRCSSDRLIASLPAVQPAYAQARTGRGAPSQEPLDPVLPPRATCVRYAGFTVPWLLP